MSVEIRAKIICDGGCGAVIDGPLQVHTTYQDSYNEARRMAQNQRWLIANRKYGKTRHLCPACADGPPKRPAKKIKEAIK